MLILNHNLTILILFSSLAICSMRSKTYKRHHTKSIYDNPSPSLLNQNPDFQNKDSLKFETNLIKNEMDNFRLKIFACEQIVDGKSALVSCKDIIDTPEYRKKCNEDGFFTYKLSKMPYVSPLIKRNSKKSKKKFKINAEKDSFFEKRNNAEREFPWTLTKNDYSKLTKTQQLESKNKLNSEISSIQEDLIDEFDIRSPFNASKAQTKNFQNHDLVSKKRKPIKAPRTPIPNINVLDKKSTPIIKGNATLRKHIINNPKLDGLENFRQNLKHIGDEKLKELIYKNSEHLKKLENDYLIQFKHGKSRQPLPKIEKPQNQHQINKSTQILQPTKRKNSTEGQQ